MPALHSRTIKKFFLQFKFLGCTISQTNAGLKKILLNPTKLEMLTSVSSVCCVGDCGEGTDWVSEDKKLKWDRRRAKCWRTWNEPTSCRPQGKLEKARPLLKKPDGRKIETKCPLRVFSLIAHQSLKVSSSKGVFLLHHFLHSIMVNQKPSKKEAFTTFLFPLFGLVPGKFCMK